MNEHVGSAHGNVKKYVGITNCLTMAGTSYMNSFQYADVLLPEVVNENASSLTANLLVVPLKSLLNVLAVL